MFINSFINDPFALARHARESRHPGRPARHLQAWTPARAGVTEEELSPDVSYGWSVAALLKLDIEAERSQFFDQHVERFGNTGLKIVVAPHNRLIDLCPARDIVRLDRQHLLQGVCRAVSLQRPHLHLAEPLPAELRLAAEGLLGNETVRTDRARMDLVVDQVMQLHHVDVADSHRTVERLAGTPIDQGHLARG